MNNVSPQPLAVAACIDTRDGAGRRRLHGVVRYGRQRGWRMMLVRIGGLAAAHEVERLRPDGIIAYVADRALRGVADRLRIPLVDTALGEAPVRHVVCLDNDAVGRLAAEHLAGTGLQHFAYCGVRRKVASGERRDRFAAHLAARGYLLHAFAQAIAEGESTLEPLCRWLAALPKPVGLLCFDDKLGERVLAACRWAGLRVPDVVAVLGVGDDELMCELSWPPLSSIASPTERLGGEAAAVLDRAMRNGRVRPSVTKVVPTAVTARGSTDVTANADPLVGSVRRLIRARAQEPIGTDDIARAVSVSRRTLDRRFALATQRTVHDELIAAKMQIARRLLSDTTSDVAQVARACGYTTPASFSRSFHRENGCWPTDFRNRARSP